MSSETHQPRRWLIATALAVAAVAAVGGWLVVSASPAAAQLGSRQGSPDAFDPFRIFKPLFERPQREQRQDREREYRQRYAPRRSRAAPVDQSRPPPPKKSDTTPSRHIVVLGSSLSDWLAYGLEEIYSDRPEIGIVRKNHLLAGLVRFDSKKETTWPEVTREFLKDRNPDVIVVLLGLEDRRAIRERVPVRDAQQEDRKKESSSAAAVSPEPRPQTTRTFEFRTDEWAEAYAKRVDEMIAALKSKGAPVIWVGLPAIRGTKSTSDMIYLNEIFRARAERAGIVYVDVWDGFVDESGRYATFGPDVEGQVRRLRTSEGVFFTKAGARKLAHYVERDIKRVMGTRLQPMAIPLDESGQPTVSGPATRPTVGPVVSLTNAAGADELLGGAARPAATDPLAERVLVRGSAITPQNGRADNFFLTPEAAEAAKVAATQLEPAPETAAPETAAVVAPAVAPVVPEPEVVVEARTGDPDKPANVDQARPAIPRRGAISRRPAARSADRRVQQRSWPSARERPIPPRDVGPYQPRRRQQPPPFDPFGLFR